MVVKILSSAASFKGVSYNTDKIDKGKGELMKVSGFGPLQGLSALRPEDYKNYLKMVSAQNKRVKSPQFHAVISAKGKSTDKRTLTDLAEKWLVSMGYGNQPYLIVHHNDTANSHVHMVTTRIDKAGKKINSGFENTRAINNLNKLLGIDNENKFSQDVANALEYNFTTKAQFMLILECEGYTTKPKDHELDVIKFGKKLGTVSLSEIEKTISNGAFNGQRLLQLKAIFHKYTSIHDTTLIKQGDSLTSAFAAWLKDKLGIVLIFHAKDGKVPYGYSIIDHIEKAVYKGSEVMALKQLLGKTTGRHHTDESAISTSIEADKTAIAYYAAILRSALYNYPDLLQGLNHQGLTMARGSDGLVLADPGTQIKLTVNELLNDTDLAYLEQQYFQQVETSHEVSLQHNNIPGIIIADDIDDEAINGRNRKRVRKARTNSR